VNSFGPAGTPLDVAKSPGNHAKKIIDAEKALVAAEKLGVARRMTAEVCVHLFSTFFSPGAAPLYIALLCLLEYTYTMTQ
jgi:hypothetical protein